MLPVHLFATPSLLPISTKFESTSYKLCTNWQMVEGGEIQILVHTEEKAGETRPRLILLASSNPTSCHTYSGWSGEGTQPSTSYCVSSACWQVG